MFPVVSRTSSVVVSTKIWSSKTTVLKSVSCRISSKCSNIPNITLLPTSARASTVSTFLSWPWTRTPQINIVTWYSACLQIILRDTNHASSFVPSSWQRGACDVWAENIRVLYLNYWFLAPSDLPIFDNFLVKSPLTDIFLLGSDTVFTMIIDNHHKEESLMLSHLPQLNCCCCSQ